MSFTTQSLSVGDRVQPGTYRIHSRFDRAVNFISRGRLVSVVDKEVGAGPRNIVLDDLNLAKVAALEIKEGMVFLDSRRYPFSEQQIFRSHLAVHGFSPQAFQKNLLFFEKLIAELAPAKSLAFLIDERRSARFMSDFERTFVERISSGVQLVFSGQISTGVPLLKGCGFGLTPSGDDFIAGLLFGLNFLQIVLKKDLRVLIDTVYEAARGGNIFSQTFLELAREGRAFARLKDLVRALSGLGEPGIHACAEKLFAVGASSGADLATGFLKTVQAELVLLGSKGLPYLKRSAFPKSGKPIGLAS